VEADLPFRGQISPETPEGRPLALFVGRFGISVGDYPTGIHPPVEQVDGSAFARSADTGKIHQDGKIPLIAQTLLQQKKIFPKQQLLLFEFLPTPAV